MEKLHKGGCLCGEVSYKVQGEPRSTVVCHCKFCQKRTGSTHAFLIYFNHDDITSVSGPLKTFRHVSDASGRWIDIQFCAKCGSSVTWTLELAPGWRGFDGGTFDDCSVFSRRVHMWTDSSHPSEKFSEDAICFPAQPPFTTEQLEAM